MPRTVTVDADLFLTLLCYAETRSMQLARACVDALARLTAEDSDANRKAYADAFKDSHQALEVIRAADAAVSTVRPEEVVGRVVKRGLSLVPPAAQPIERCWNCGAPAGHHRDYCPVIPLEERVLPLVPKAEAPRGYGCTEALELIPASEPLVERTRTVLER